MAKAILLCGGQGTRLRPYTYSIPKPMLPLGSRPILQFVIENMKRAGIDEIYLTVGYLKSQIIEYFGSGEKFGVKLHYVSEEVEQNTAGSTLPLSKEFDEPFVVGMGDHLSSIDIKEMLTFHKEKGGIATIGLKRQGVPLEYGIAEVKDGRITSFREKPILQNFVNAGVYVFDPKIFSYIKPREDFAKDVFPRLLADRHQLNAFIFDSYWLDIGRTTDYEQLNQLISVIDLVAGKKL
ncbi:Bifunctional protein GlmU [Candidatus Anstonella stagnisolia]|nr:Bifunctional protein GlmU [Candidatus Anstonella stagnisolia]